MFDERLLQLLVCPVSGGTLVFADNRKELWCQRSGLAYPVLDGIPAMLENEARTLSAEEQESLSRQ